MGREGSGTAWLPDSTPMAGIHVAGIGFHWMIHGQLYGVANFQGSARGDSDLFATNWIMAMGSRPVAGGDLMLRGMASLEPLTTG